MYQVLVHRYNQNHITSGPDGGQFTSGGGAAAAPVWAPVGNMQALDTPVTDHKIGNDSLDSVLGDETTSRTAASLVADIIVHGTKEAFAYHDANSQIAEDYISKESGDTSGEYRKYLKLYQGSDYAQTNNYLRDGKTVDRDGEPRNMALVNTMTETLDKGLINAPVVPTGTQIYRAFRNEEIASSPAKLVGMTFRDPGFLSTTVDQNTARTFYGFKQMDGNGSQAVIIRMKTPEGLRGQYMNASYGSNQPSEFEIILPRNTAFKITGATNISSGGVVLDAEIVH